MVRTGMTGMFMQEYADKQVCVRIRRFVSAHRVEK